MLHAYLASYEYILHRYRCCFSLPYIPLAVEKESSVVTVCAGARYAGGGSFEIGATFSPVYDSPLPVIVEKPAPETADDG